MGLVSFLGIKKFGQALASAGRVFSGEVNQDIKNQQEVGNYTQKLLYAARNEKDPNKKKRLLQVAQQNGSPIAASDIDPGLNLSNREVVGSAANVVLNVATPGAFKGGKLAKIAKNTALGAGYGTASGLEKNRNATGVVGSAIGGALVGAGLGVSGLMVKAAKDFITRTPANWLMNHAIKPSLNELRKNVKFGTKTLGQELLDEGVKGGPKKLLDIAEKRLNTFENELEVILNNPSLSQARITRQQIFPYIKDLTARKMGTPGSQGDVQRIKGIVDSIPEQLTLQEANQMKRRIYFELRDPAYKLDAKLSTKAETIRSIAKGLKMEIEKTVGGTAVKDINRKLSIYGRLEDAIIDQLARSMRNNGLSLTDAILVAGGEVGPKGFLAAILRHTIGSTGSMTRAANILNKASKIGTGKVGRASKNIIRRGALNLP